MTDKSIDTLEQIETRYGHTIVLEDGVESTFKYINAADLPEILAIAIKSPEAAEYWCDEAINAGSVVLYRSDYPADEETVARVCKAIEALKEAQNE